MSHDSHHRFMQLPLEDRFSVKILHYKTFSPERMLLCEPQLTSSVPTTTFGEQIGSGNFPHRACCTMWHNSHHKFLKLPSKSGGQMSSRLPFWEIGESEYRGFETSACGFETWLSQTNDFKIDTCCFLAWSSALIGLDKDWLTQCQDNVTE